MGKNFRETLNEQLRDPEFKAEWDALDRSALRPFGEIVRWSVLLIRDLPCLMGNEVDHIKRTSRYEILSEKISPLCGSACFPRLPLPLGSHGHWSSPR